MYRELPFVERCACNDPAVGPCASCGRARCAYHLVGGLCMRCAEAFRREITGSSGPVWIAGVTLVGVTITTLALHLAFGILLGLPLAVASYVGARRWQRHQLIKYLGPKLSASRGELPPPPREPTWSPGENSVPTGHNGQV